MNRLAIVVTAYNRPAALSNLLKSLSNIDVTDAVDLVISIDNNGTAEVNKIATQYLWPHGFKKVLIHSEKKGLVNHFIWTGDLTQEYEHVIFLEDDLIVAPCLIHTANQVIDYYKNDEMIAAASLYNPIICEMTGGKFYQIQDGYDFYFLQQPYWGKIWFRNKWQEFKKYLANYRTNKELLPPSIAGWEKSFKKIFIQYLIENKKYVVTPRISVVTNSGVAGLHSAQGLYQYQNVMLAKKTAFRMCRCDESLARYDAFMEIEPEILNFYNAELKAFNYTVDTKGIRQNYNSPYVLTTKPVKNRIFCFSSLTKPIEASVIYDEKGDGELKLCKKEDVLEKNKFYFTRRFKDIEKNYWIGISAGLCISLSTITSILKIFLRKTFGIILHK